MKTSVSYKCSLLVFKFFNYKKKFKNPNSYMRFLRKKGKKNDKYFTIYPVIKRLEYTKESIDGMVYYDINAHGDKTILFIAGGSFLDNPTEIHWLYVEKLVKECNARVILPIYPKLPMYCYKDCYPKMEKLYDSLKEEPILLADSAGGNIGLGLLYKKKQFKKAILISPWVDLRMTNKDMIKDEANDPILSIELLRNMGLMWSHDEENEITSPILGDPSFINNLYVFAGTNEIFIHDIRLFVKKCKQNVSYYEYEKMNHGFVLHPIKEAKEASIKVIDIINDKEI